MSDDKERDGDDLSPTAEPSAEAAPSDVVSDGPALAGAAGQGGDVTSHSAPRYAAVPEEPDPPSYAPIVTGLGIAVTAWGFLTNLTILALGAFLFCYGMSIWIKELTHEP
jgi:hypothetical protein